MKKSHVWDRLFPLAEGERVRIVKVSTWCPDETRKKLIGRVGEISRIWNTAESGVSVTLDHKLDGSKEVYLRIWDIKRLRRIRK